VLGWTPKVALDDGLTKAAAYFRQMLTESREREGRAGI
jgi:hypothetical protein